MNSSSKDAAWLAIQSVITLAFGLVSTVLAARIYGPSTMGNITFAVAYTTLFSPIVRLGLDGIIIHEIVRRPQGAKQVLWTSIWLRCLSGVLTVAIIYLSTRLPPLQSANDTWIAIMSLSLFSMVGESLLGALQAQGLIKLGAIARICVSFGTLSLRASILVLGFPVEWYVYTYVLDAVLMVFALGLAHKCRSNLDGRATFSVSVAALLLRRSWPLIASGLAVAIFTRIDQVMIVPITGSTANAAIYAAAATISEMWYFVPMALITVMRVQIMSADVDSDVFVERVRLLFDLVVATSVFFCVVLSVGAWPALRLLYGAAYTNPDSVISVVALSWAGLFAMIGSARAPWLIAKDLQWYSLVFLATGCAINVVANLIVIPVWGIVGAAVATVLAQLVANLILPFIFAETRGSAIDSVKSIRPSVLASTSYHMISIVRKRGRN